MTRQLATDVSLLSSSATLLNVRTVCLRCGATRDDLDDSFRCTPCRTGDNDRCDPADLQLHGHGIYRDALDAILDAHQPTPDCRCMECRQTWPCRTHQWASLHWTPTRA